MTIAQMQAEILRLKKLNDVTILAHSYVRREVIEIADEVGDSFALARAATKANTNTVLLCGVRFMAETVKILAPEKRVLLSNSDAGCPMADQLDEELLAGLKEQYPNAAVAAYINTTARLKAHADVCVTSSSAEKILSKLPEQEILFVPDINLGRYVAGRLPEKKFYFMQGGCPTHVRAGAGDATRAKSLHPNALLLVHPECRPEVVAFADYVGSTSGIIEFARRSAAQEFIIGTENAVLEHLQYECPEKSFYPLSKDFVCHNMKLTTLTDVLNCCRGKGEEITLPEDVRVAAKRASDRMIALGG